MRPDVLMALEANGMFITASADRARSVGKLTSISNCGLLRIGRHPAMLTFL